MGKCSTKYCRKKTIGKRLLCSKCSSKKWRENNPAAYVFHNLKHNAARRGKQFNITLNEFRDWLSSNDYLSGRGKTANSLSIDRIDINDPRGYHIENIQVLTLSENSRKRFVDYDFDNPPVDDLPF